jgi:Protein of unknown function (DUF3168)
MSIEGAIVLTLKADSAVTAIVAGRVYPMIAPQSAAMPRVTYTIVSTDIDQILTGPSGLRITRMQIDNRATSYAQAKSLADLVRAALDNLSGLIDSTDIQTVQVQTLIDNYEQPTDGDQIGTYNVVLELVTHHN